MTYENLLNNPPKLTVKDNAKEVVITLISCMCDNRALMTFKKNDSGEFKLNTHSNAYGNFQIRFDKYELEWLADEGNWQEVFNMINTGTSLISKVISR